MQKPTTVVRPPASLGQPGTYPIVSHSFAYTELGVVGLLEVTE